MNPFVVSTECPLCSAPLDFSEGSNAVQCLHCRANLLVTGRKQVLSYYIEPKIDRHVAVAAAMTDLKNRGTALDEYRVVKPALYFVPYYRLTGHDFGWEKQARKPVEEEIEEEASGLEAGLSIRSSFSILEGFAIKVLKGAEGEKDIYRLLLYGSKESSGPLGVNEILLNDRYIEKNFTACNLGEAGMYSIGVRAAVLKLRLFNEAALSSLGRIVGPEVCIEDALAKGMKSDFSGEILYRAVIGRILSVIYFPFWGVEIEHRGEGMISIVDGVSKTVVSSGAAAASKKAIGNSVPPAGKRAGFRPLVCPNCGWDLPAHTDDAVFICSSCNRGWQIYGDELHEIEYRIAAPKGSCGQDKARYLPFWVIGSEKDGRPFSFFMPAFHCRRLKFLSDLATGISRIQPEYDLLEVEKFEIHSGRFEGCYYDQEDAALLACFVNAGMELKKGNKNFAAEPVPIKSAVLTWFPFAVNGVSLVDPFTGTNLALALISK